MKVPNKKIGVLDLNIDNLFILNSLRQKFINDDIYYINDVSIENVYYFGKKKTFPDKDVHIGPYTENVKIFKK